MKKFWNWIHDDSGGRVLRLEGPIDEDDFWGDKMGISLSGSIRRVVPSGPLRRSIP